VLFKTAFRFYPATPLLLFEQRFPHGVANTNLTVPVNSTSSPAGAAATARLEGGALTAGEFAASLSPCTQFPTLVAVNGSHAAAAAGYLTWVGRFAGPVFAPSGGASAAFRALGGAEGGPVVLFSPPPTNSSAAGPSVVWTPAGNFKGSMLGPAVVGAAGSGAAGLNGYVTSIPADFSVLSALYFTHGGVNAAMHGAGAALQAALLPSPRLHDPSSTKITYWTDSE
jgi:hypothetical protein